MKTILFANDHPQMRRYVSTELAHEGYQVSCTEMDDSIWKKIKTLRPDMVLVDLYINGFDGWNLFNDIKEKYKTLPVIICGLQNSQSIINLKKIMITIQSTATIIS